MPTAQIRRAVSPPVLSDVERAAIEQLPAVLHTPSGVVMIDIQGVINLGESPLIANELDLEGTGARRHDAPVRIGKLEFTGGARDGAQVSLMIGSNQKLWGTLQELKVPLAVLKMQEESDVEVVEVIKYKALFNKRPEPVLNQ